MLRIKIELVPYGKEEWTRELGSIDIINDHNRLQSAFKILQAVLNKALPE
jgi:hypothetical protein